MPSNVINRPAAAPRTVDRNIRRVIRISSRIDNVPKTIGMIRQPNVS